MKPEQSQIIKFGTTWGIITGVISILYTVALIYSDNLYQQSFVKSIIGLLLLVIPISIAIFQFKKQNKALSVGQAIGIGTVTACVAALITIFFTYLLANFLIPDFWDKSAEYNKILLQQQSPNITAQQLNAKIASQRKLAWITYPFIFLFNLAIGFITSLFTGIALKTTEKM